MLPLKSLIPKAASTANTVCLGCKSRITSIVKDVYKRQPVMSLYSKIASVSTYKENTPISYARSYYTKSERTIATVCAGYADGYFRALSNKSEVYVNGERAHCVGTICMDMFMICLLYTSVFSSLLNAELETSGR